MRSLVVLHWRSHITRVSNPRRGVRPRLLLRGASAQDRPPGPDDPVALMVVGPIGPGVRCLEVRGGLGVRRADELLVDGHHVLLSLYQTFYGGAQERGKTVRLSTRSR